MNGQLDIQTGDLNEFKSQVKLNNNDLRKITDLIKKFFVNFSY